MTRSVAYFLVVATLVTAFCGCEDDEGSTTAPDPNPQVTITSPVNGARIGDLLTMEVTAGDDKGVAYVQFYFDGFIFGTDFAPPYKFQKSTASYSHLSEHSIFAVAYDTDDNKTGSVPLFVTIDTLLAAPTGIVVHEPPVMTTTTATLTWSMNKDVDFSQYRIRYDTTGPGQVMPIRKVLMSASDTTWTVTGLNDTMKYRFTVEVIDYNGHVTIGNEVEGTTLNAPPTAPVIISVLRKSDRLSFRWSAVSLQDFASFRVVRSTDSTYDDADQVLTTITDPNTKTHDYMTVDPTEFVYFIVTVDKGGLRAASSPARESSAVSRYALQYDGSKYCTVPYFAALDVGDTYTLEAWINQTQTSAFMRVIDKSPDGAPYLQYSLISDAALGADFCGDGSPVRVHGAVGVPLDEWHHAALSYDHGVIIYYIDGVPVDTSMTSVTFTCTFATTLNIGRRKMFNEFYFRGMIDEVRVWNVVRTPAEISGAYNSHLTGSEPGLVCYYDFDEGSGGAITSPVGGNGYLGESSGADSADPTWVVSEAPIQY